MGGMKEGAIARCYDYGSTAKKPDIELKTARRTASDCCEHFDGIEHCRNPGTMSHTIGPNSKWYCRKHFWMH